jgi:hypothetical protein
LAAKMATFIEQKLLVVGLDDGSSTVLESLNWLNWALIKAALKQYLSAPNTAFLE